MNVCFRTLPLAALLGLVLVAGCDPKSPKVTADPRPPTGEREPATGTVTGSGGGGGGGGSTGAPVGGGAGTGAPAVAVPASQAASMAAGADDMANRPGAAPAGGTRAAPGGDVPPRPAAAPRLSSRERSFVLSAAGLGLYEIAAARLGQQRAKDPAVRAYAEHMAHAHAQAQAGLQELAAQHRITLPTQMPADRLTVIERLERSESFDTAFVNTVGVQDHRSTIERFEQAARDAQDTQLKAWIAHTLPSLREHLAQAQKLPEAGAPGR